MLHFHMKESKNVPGARGEAGGGVGEGAGMKWKSFPYVLQAITSSLHRRALFLERGLNGAFYAWLSTDTKMPGLLHI